MREEAVGEMKGPPPLSPHKAVLRGCSQVRCLETPWFEMGGGEEQRRHLCGPPLCTGAPQRLCWQAENPVMLTTGEALIFGGLRWWGGIKELLK